LSAGTTFLKANRNDDNNLRFDFDLSCRAADLLLLCSGWRCEVSELIQVVNPIIQYITMMGGIAIRINSGVIPVEGKKTRMFRGAPAGTSDIIGCWRGRFLAIECKLTGNKPTALQLEFLERVQAAGGIGIVAYSIDDVIKVLEEI
jgi:hypothetical protein